MNASRSVGKTPFWVIFFNFFYLISRVSFEESGRLNAINQYVQITDVNGWFSIDFFGQIELPLLKPFAPDRIAIAFPAKNLEQFPATADKDEIMA